VLVRCGAGGGGGARGGGGGGVRGPRQCSPARRSKGKHCSLRRRDHFRRDRSPGSTELGRVRRGAGGPMQCCWPGWHWRRGRSDGCGVRQNSHYNCPQPSRKTSDIIASYRIYCLQLSATFRYNPHRFVETIVGRKHMPVGKLNARKVATAKPGKYGDGGGLWLFVGPNSKSWVFSRLRAECLEL